MAEFARIRVIAAAVPSRQVEWLSATATGEMNQAVAEEVDVRWSRLAGNAVLQVIAGPR